MRREAIDEGRCGARKLRVEMMMEKEQMERKILYSGYWTALTGSPQWPVRVHSGSV